jgi:hypothetical protein
MKIKTGDRVAYHPQGDPQAPIEFGVVTLIHRPWVFVRFDGQPVDTRGKACRPSHLELLGGKS